MKLAPTAALNSTNYYTVSGRLSENEVCSETERKVRGQGDRAKTPGNVVVGYVEDALPLVTQSLGICSRLQQKDIFGQTASDLLM